MTPQVLLSMVFGFGVLALATIALLNAAGHRLHDLEVFDREGRSLAFVYRYSSQSAARLRVWFSRLPLFVGLGAFVAVSTTYVLYEATAVPLSQDDHGTQRHLMPIDVLTWTMVIMGGYVLVLVFVTSILSAGLYHAIGIFNHSLPRMPSAKRDLPHLPRAPM